MRGGQWGGYYRRDSLDNPSRVFGIEWLNAFDCGSYIDADGVRQGVSFIIFYKNEFPDCYGKFAESFDVSLDDADYFVSDPLYQAAAAGVPITLEIVESVQWAVPSVKYLVTQDVLEGLTGLEIFDRRVGVLNYRFLGFTFDEMIQANPDFVQITIDPETNIETMNLQRCSLEEA